MSLSTDTNPIELSTAAGLKITILGSGSSGGVPRIGNDWGACDPSEPKNRRRRCSLLVEQGDTKVLIDTSPDLREQLLDAEIGRLDAVLYTHQHADQAHGIDDLRVIALRMRRQVPVYMNEETKADLLPRFHYCFEMPPGSGYPPILDLKSIGTMNKSFMVPGEGGALEVIPFLVNHGPINALGFRIGPLAYSPDLVGLPEPSFDVLDGVECWIVDALRYTPHVSHAHLELTLSWLERVRPRLGILTNLHVDLDYQTLKGELQPGIIPAYDGLVIRL